MATPTPDAPENFDQFDDDDSEQQLGATASGRKRLFSKELRCMMYGFGDDQNPYTESVDFLEDLVIEFLTETTHRAMEVGRTGRVQVEDIIFLVRKDQRKYARVKDLLTMNEELKKARKAFDEVKYVEQELLYVPADDNNEHSYTNTTFVVSKIRCCYMLTVILNSVTLQGDKQKAKHR